ncbi:RNA polymerase sigma factor [Luteimicrobium subarcticum]|uniref:RNA polymerase sigma-70 factor (ECF subfamily) n=1 Tax=Luteimicrobium subarcticum TaxID=620910 RepID=A0A2M8W743_9MICO|nr:sigma-70 family RNA polymerase sigma factor [Luteimicrobium subarcticum]PJI86712.1 RNA polymerase sigma-70 factor (ECF subfamily) [Luteimicrobium subarcticum]
MRRWEGELSDLVHRRSGALVGYAFLLCEDRREAEDLVQEALYKVFARGRRPGLRAPRTDPTGATLPVDTGPAHFLEAYVRTTILNLYLDGYRRRQRFAGFEHRLVTPDCTRGPESGATARADVVAALSRLTPRQRACVVLRFFEDQTVPQVAATLGIAQGTVKRRLFEALDVLRDALGDLTGPQKTTAGVADSAPQDDKEVA